MILLADSGSTKTDWRIIKDNNLICSFKTSGLNPYFVSNNEMTHEILNSFPLTFDKSEIKEIHFFGAGCSTNEKKLIINNNLASIFSKSTIEIQSDMVGAAKALFGNESGIALILGTGSNSCEWNGAEITSNSPSLGYILGDEGSGTHLGLTFIKKYLNNELPLDIKTLFEDNYPISREIILENVYKKSFPNRYLAQYCYFLKETIDNPFIEYLVTECFLEFIQKHVKVFENIDDKKIRSVGSIAFHFEEILQKCALASEIEIDKVIQTPIEGLVALYCSK